MAKIGIVAHHGPITRQHACPRHLKAPRSNLLTWANVGNTAVGAGAEHDGTATAGDLDVPKSSTTTEKSVTKLFSSAVQRPLWSVNVHRCYLVPAGVPG
jgi:hypothetical protein